jgi:hypothetical protein
MRMGVFIQSNELKRLFTSWSYVTILQHVGDSSHNGIVFYKSVFMNDYFWTFEIKYTQEVL